MKKIYKWGVLGCGNMAHKFVQDLQRLEQAELFATASRSAEKARAFAEQYQASRYYADYQSLAADPDIDIVYIATPHAMHHENTLDCLNAGKAVLCEKPMAINGRQLDEMLQRATEKNVFLMEALWTRFLPVLPAIQRLQKELLAGRIGDIVEVKADFGYAWPFDPESRVYNPNLGGGSLLDVGIYPLFLALLLLGEPGRVEAKSHLAATGVDADCEMHLIYADTGQAAYLFSSVNRETKLEAEIVGTRGCIKIPAPWFRPEALHIMTDAGNVELIQFDYKGNGFSYEALEVMRCLSLHKKQSDLYPWAFSKLLMKMMDEIRCQCCIKYPKYD